MASIKSQVVDIHPETKIALDADIKASDSIFIGEYAVIGSGFKARCRSLTIGRHCYIGKDVEIGGGGCDGLNSHVSIGPESLIANGSFINCAESVTIGRHVAFGYEVQIWTHGVWQPVVDGYPPQKQLPVTIGDEVWLPSRCQVLPGVVIGNNVVVGMGSIVNRDLPDGCMAAGMPSKIIKEQRYPVAISDEELDEILSDMADSYMDIAMDKGYIAEIYIADDCIIRFIEPNTNGTKEVRFNPKTKTYEPEYLSIYAEDFRDYLRRNGFPFYQGGFFESIEPTRFKELE